MNRAKIILPAFLAFSIIFSACGPAASAPEETPLPSGEIVAPSPEPQPEQTAAPENDAGFSFSELCDYSFTFSSGAGAWSTDLQISADGSFSGGFHDSNMGEIDEGYSNGTVYSSSFSGRFSAPEKMNDYTYFVKLLELSYEKPFGEEIIDNIRYVYTDAYGLSDSENFLIFLPEADVSLLPEQFCDWVGMSMPDSLSSGKLSSYGLYNADAECGFWSAFSGTSKEHIAKIVSGAEASAAEVDLLLENEMLTQQEMNMMSYDLYTIWDDALNEIWNILKYSLDHDDFSTLLDEQIEWINYKESTAKAEAAENEGGSIYPLILNHTLSELTKERVYYLASLLD